LRATFVYANSRRELLTGLAAGTEPDSALLGANHLAAHAIDVRIYDPLLTRRHLPSPLDRLAWNLRELTVPLEVGPTDVLFTPLANVLPLTARVRGIKTIVINFGLNLIRRRAGAGRRIVLDRSLCACARVICLGESQRDELVDAGLPPELLEVVPLPVDARFFTPTVVDVREASVLTVGKDLARDYATFLDAVVGLGVPVELGVHPRNLQGLHLPEGARARWASSIELRELYASAGCVVLPQRVDGHPYGSEGGGLTALLEAMAMGKAIVASERGVLRDYVTDGVDALIVPPEDPAALRAAIERVLGDHELAQRLGHAARSRVERDHTTPAFAARLAPLLRSVV
jgi:hypothetical protein